MCKYDCFALPSGAWIITGGMHAGVMKHVGEAVRDYSVGASSKNKVIALAVCPWGCVQGRQGLVDPSVSISHIFDLLNKPRFVKKSEDLHHGYMIKFKIQLVPLHLLSHIYAKFRETFSI